MRPHLLTWLCVLAVAGLGAAVPGPSARAQAPPTSTPARKAVIGYVFPQDTRLDPAQIAADQLTHINYAFANIRDGEVVEGFRYDTENFAALTGLRRSAPHLQILVSVGGWTWSGGFSDAARTPASRERFVKSAVAFVVRHDLDGFDVDWEYPGLPGAGNTHRPEDRATFTALMQELRAALDAAGRPRGRRYLLTFAAGAFPRFIEHTELDRVQASVDFVNLMTYDFRVGNDTTAGHHANLFDHPSDEKRRSAERAVAEFLAAGVPAPKLVLGVPFYGRGWIAKTAEANGLYQAAQPLVPRMNLSYGRLAADLVGRDGFIALLGRAGGRALPLARRSPHLHQLRRPRVAPSQEPFHPRSEPRRRHVLAVRRGPLGRAPGDAPRGAGPGGSVIKGQGTKDKGRRTGTRDEGRGTSDE